jgi:hypothetical protein
MLLSLQALRPLSDPAAQRLCSEELAQKLGAVCSSALGAHVSDLLSEVPAMTFDETARDRSDLSEARPVVVICRSDSRSIFSSFCSLVIAGRSWQSFDGH